MKHNRNWATKGINYRLENINSWMWRFSCTQHIKSRQTCPLLVLNFLLSCHALGLSLTLLQDASFFLSVHILTSKLKYCLLHKNLWRWNFPLRPGLSNQLGKHHIIIWRSREFAKFKAALLDCRMVLKVITSSLGL